MSDKQHPLLLGAHMSIAGGLELAYQAGESIGCTAMQIFTKSNRQWAAKALDNDAITGFKQAQQASSIRSTIAHATYLINIGAIDHVTHQKSVAALMIELERCEQLNIPYLVLHPGSHGNTDEKSCLNKISDTLNTIFNSTTTNTTILLENMAGQGNSVCYLFEHIGHIIAASDFKKRLGICFDTCHAFAAGYDFRTVQTYQDMWQAFDEAIGIDKLKAMHINDSKKPLGSRVDRHEDIGRGSLGLEPFSLLFNDPRFFDVPKILETPQSTHSKSILEDYARNMNTVKSLIIR
jgi:deoxyribonuclease IV